MTEHPTPLAAGERADRLVAARRWTHGDIDLLQRLFERGDVSRAALLAEEPSAERSLRSLVVVGLATETGEGIVALSVEGRELAPLVLDRLRRRKAIAASRTERHTEAHARDEATRATVVAAIHAVFPAIPDEVANAAADRLLTGVIKSGGRRPAEQSVVEAVAVLRFERWRQAVVAEPEVATRLSTMTARGDNNRARKRYRDQRAADRVRAELAAWRGDLRPVESRRLG